MIKLKNLLTEINAQQWNWYKNWCKKYLPNWPEYVIKDMLFTKLTSHEDLEDKKNHMLFFRDEYPNMVWKLEKLNDITFDSFSKETKDKMFKRKMGNENLFQVPNDKKRLDSQIELIRKNGVSKLPIIVIKQNDGYDLWEGWHRTFANMKAFLEGYNCNAWVGYV